MFMIMKSFIGIRERVVLKSVYFFGRAQNNEMRAAKTSISEINILIFAGFVGPI